MVKSIGLDIVEVQRIKELLEQYGAKFIGKILSSSEISLYENKPNDLIFLAGRFAAKEAVRKATGENLKWTDVEITNEERGKPIVRLSDRNLTGGGTENTRILLSISHTDEYAVAYVVVQTTDHRQR